MLDIRFVREHLDEVATAMQNRNHTWDSARFQELDESRRASIAKEEELQAKRNAISKSIGKLMGEGKKEEAEAAKAEVSRAQRPNRSVQRRTRCSRRRPARYAHVHAEHAG